MSWFQARKKGTHASTGDSLPLAKADDLVVEEIGDELLIYDKTTNRAHSLSATAARVWRACDGHKNTSILRAELELDSDTLAQALYELRNSSLLQDDPEFGHTRREMVGKGATLGAAASVPFIYSVLGPVPMAAATPTPAQCLHYTARNCGSVSSGGCGSICGCCCCCTGCDTSNGGTGCAICYPSSMCPASGSQCPSNSLGVTGTANTGDCTTKPCSTPGSGCNQPCTVPVNVTGSDLCTSAFPSPCAPGF